MIESLHPTLPSVRTVIAAFVLALLPLFGCGALLKSGGSDNPEPLRRIDELKGEDASGERMVAIVGEYDLSTEKTSYGKAVERTFRK